MSIPADFRRVLEARDPEWSEGRAPRMVINFRDQLNGGLQVQTLDGQAEIEELVRSLPRGSKKRKLAERDFLLNVRDLSIDDNGRIVLPQQLRETLGLPEGGTVVAHGLGETFELWEPATYDKVHGNELDDFVEELGDDFDSEMLLDEALQIREERARRDARE